MKQFFLLALIICLMGAACGPISTERSYSETNTTGSVSINADIWADNWFALYVGEQLIKEDSVSITTERSFNAESFNFKSDYPIVLNIIAKDYKENDTGLEYIGENNQQMGDGGLIAQFKDATTNELIASTGNDWQCLVIHEAPLDKSCEKSSNPTTDCAFEAQNEPEAWKTPSFDTNSWQSATVYSAAQVSPKDGYDEISWHSNAKLIWGDDLETNNTLLCRLVVDAP